MEYSPSLGIQVGVDMKYVDRGDPEGPDFFQPTSITADGTYHDLDLSEIVAPAGADHLVFLQFRGNTSDLPSKGYIRMKGRVNEYNVVQFEASVIAGNINQGIWVMMDANRKIEYKFTADPMGWSGIKITVRGWIEKQ